MPQLDIGSFFHQLIYLNFVFYPSFFYFLLYIINQIYLILRLKIVKLELLTEQLKYNIIRKSNRLKKLSKLSVIRFDEVVSEFKTFNIDLNRINLNRNFDLIYSSVNYNILKTLFKIKLLILE